MKTKPSCHEKLDFQSYLDQQMTLPERLKVDRHLRDCNDCEQNMKAYSRLFEELGSNFMPQKSDLPTQDDIRKVMGRLHTKKHNTRFEPMHSVTGILAELIRLQKYVIAGIGVCIAFFLYFAFQSKPSINVPAITVSREAASAYFTYKLFAPNGKGLNADGNSLRSLPFNGGLELGTTYNVPQLGKLLVTFAEENRMRFSSQAQFQVSKSGVTLLSGELMCDFKKGGSGFVITTPAGTITSNGTRFFVEVSPGSTRVDLEEGNIILRTKSKTQVMKNLGSIFLMANGAIQSGSDNLELANVPPVKRPVSLNEAPISPNETFVSPNNNSDSAPASTLHDSY